MVRKIDSIQVLDRLKAAIATLPEKSAELHVSEDRDPRACFPGWRFRITPTKPGSASVQGFVDSVFGVWFTIGQATRGEAFLAGRNGKQNQIEEDAFFDICHAVFTTHFSEEVTYSSSNQVLRSRITLRVGERTVCIGGHQVFWWLYPTRTTKRFSYEPYY
jgi:hypothetical protein